MSLLISPPGTGGGGGGTGDVTGPGSSVDNAIVRFDGTTGKLIQDYTSGAPTIGDTGAITVSSTVNKITITAPATGSTLTIDDGFTLHATGNVTALSGAHTGASSGTNTGDQTTVSGNAGTATALQNARTIGGVSFDGTANITVATATGGFTVSGGNLALGTNTLTLTGSIASTGSRVTKGWFTDLEVTNAIVGSVTGSAGSVTTNANLTGPITSVGNATSIASQTGTGTKFVVDTSPTLVTPTIGVATATTVNKVTITAPASGATLTIDDGFTLHVTGNVTALSGSSTGANTGDQTTVSGNAGTATALQNARTIGGVSFNGTANITVATATGGFTVSGGALAMGANDITMTGTLGTTGSRLTKGWFTDLQVTNAIAGSITGLAGTATALATPRTIGGVSFDGTANITVATATGGFTVSGGNLVLGTNTLTLTGSIASTGSRVTKGWFTDLEVTNAIVGSVTGSAATVTTNANLTGPITSVGNATSIASQTGTGTKFVVDTSPTLVTPVIGVATGTSLTLSGLTANKMVIAGTAGLLSDSPFAYVASETGMGAGTTTGRAMLESITCALGIQYSPHTTGAGSFPTHFIGETWIAASNMTFPGDPGTPDAGATLKIRVNVSGSNSHKCSGGSATDLYSTVDNGNTGEVFIISGGSSWGQNLSAGHVHYIIGAQAYAQNSGGSAASSTVDVMTALTLGFDGSGLVDTTVGTVGAMYSINILPGGITSATVTTRKLINIGAQAGSATNDYAIFSEAVQASVLYGPLSLGLASTHTGYLILNHVSSANYVALGASATTSVYTFTLPANGGTNGYVLSTNGSGVTSWIDVSGGTGANTALSNLASVAINTSLLLGSSDGGALGSTTKQWSDLFLAEGGVINWDNGDVTITQTGNTLAFAGASTAYTFDSAVTATTSYTGPLLIGGSGTTQTLTLKTTTGVGTTNADMIFQVGNNGATEAARILNSGFVGIGTAAPATKFHVSGASVGSFSPSFLGAAAVDTTALFQTTLVAKTTNSVQASAVASTEIALTGTPAIYVPLGLSASVTVTSTDDATWAANGFICGVSGAARYEGTGTIPAVIGVSAYTNRGNSGNVTVAMVGVDISSTQDNSAGNGTVTLLDMIRINQPTGKAGMTYTNVNGIDIGNMTPTAGTLTNPSRALKIASQTGTGAYAIEQLGSDDINYFAGLIGLGETAPKSRLHITGASGWIIQDEQDTNPTSTELDSLDSVAVYNKANKFIVAYNNGGTVTYISIPLDGSTTTWTHSTSAP